MAALSELRLAFNFSSISIFLLYFLVVWAVKRRPDGLWEDIRMIDSATMIMPFISFMPMMLTVSAWLSLRRLEEIRGLRDSQRLKSLKVTATEAVPYLVTTIIHNTVLLMQTRLFWAKPDETSIFKKIQYNFLFPLSLLIFALSSLWLMRNTRMALVHREEAISSYLQGTPPRARAHCGDHCLEWPHAYCSVGFDRRVFLTLGLQFMCLIYGIVNSSVAPIITANITTDPFAACRPLTNRSYILDNCVWESRFDQRRAAVITCFDPIHYDAYNSVYDACTAAGGLVSYYSQARAAIALSSNCFFFLMMNEVTRVRGWSKWTQTTGYRAAITVHVCVFTAVTCCLVYASILISSEEMNPILYFVYEGYVDIANVIGWVGAIVCCNFTSIGRNYHNLKMRLKDLLGGSRKAKSYNVFLTQCATLQPRCRHRALFLSCCCA